MLASRPLRSAVTVSVLTVLLAALSVLAGPPEDFHRGFYLQVHDRDAAAAAAAFERVVGADNVPAAMRDEARRRLAECREDVAAADLARLMPPAALAYIEIREPGDQLVRLIKMLGLADAATKSAGVSDGNEPIPLGNGFVLPANFAISRSLLAAMKEVKGAAVALTSLDFARQPDGVLILHPGDSAALRGIIETAVQFLQPAEPVEGFTTYNVHGQAWVAVTSRLVIAGTSRDQIVGVVQRLVGRGDGGLDLSRFAEERRDALLFAYADGPKVVEAAKGHLRGQQAMIIRSVLDLDHIEAVTIAAGVTEHGVGLQARLDLLDGHQNLIYGMIRTAACSQHSLKFVPSGAAAVLLIGLNPTAQPIRLDTDGGTTHLTAMDLGREVFANMQEVAVFVMPTAGASHGQPTAGPRLPDIGVVIMSNDAPKSAALWDRLLSLPAQFGLAPGGNAADAPPAPGATREYRLPNCPPIALCQLGEDGIVIGTSGGVEAVQHANADRASIVTDEAFAPLLGAMTKSTSKALLVHVGRSLTLAAEYAPSGEQPKLKMAGSLLKDLRAAVVSNEEARRFTIRAELTGMPNVPSVIRALAKARMAGQERMAATTRPAVTRE